MKLKHVIMAGVLTACLVPAPSAWAQWGPDSQQPSPQYREGGRPGTNPRSIRLRELANQLETSVERVTDIADRYAYASNRYEYVAIRQMEAFQTEARRFNREARFPQPPDQRRAEFDRLTFAYHRAAESLPRLHGYPYARRDFDRASYLMDQISDVVEHRGPRPGYGG